MVNARSVIGLLAVAGMAWPAHAVYRCEAKDGRVTFQDAPCSNAAAKQSRPIGALPGVAPPSAPAPAPPAVKVLTVEQRMVHNYERERRIGEMQQQIAYIEGVIDNRSVRMDAEIGALRSKKQYANNNLAGATWEASISAEMQAITAKYQALNEVDFERLKVLRDALEKAKAVPVAR